MKFALEFETPEGGLEATHLARLLLDLQHLAVIAVALGREVLTPTEPALSLFTRKYEFMVSADTAALRDSTVFVTRIV